MNRHLGEVSSTMIELVAGIKVVKAFSKTGKPSKLRQRSEKLFLNLIGIGVRH